MVSFMYFIWFSLCKVRVSNHQWLLTLVFYYIHVLAIALSYALHCLLQQWRKTDSPKHLCTGLSGRNSFCRIYKRRRKPADFLRLKTRSPAFAGLFLSRDIISYLYSIITPSQWQNYCNARGRKQISVIAAFKWHFFDGVICPSAGLFWHDCRSKMSGCRVSLSDCRRILSACGTNRWSIHF